MEDWKYDLLLRLKREDPDAFAGLNLNDNMVQCFRRMADKNFEIIGGRLCQAVTSKKKVTIWLKEPADVPTSPTNGIDYRVEQVNELRWVPVPR